MNYDDLLAHAANRVELKKPERKEDEEKRCAHYANNPNCIARIRFNNPSEPMVLYAYEGYYWVDQTKELLSGPRLYFVSPQKLEVDICPRQALDNLRLLGIDYMASAYKLIGCFERQIGELTPSATNPSHDERFSGIGSSEIGTPDDCFNGFVELRELHRFDLLRNILIELDNQSSIIEQDFVAERMSLGRFFDYSDLSDPLAKR